MVSALDRMERGIEPTTCYSSPGKCLTFIKVKAKELKKEALAVQIAIADERTPTMAKVVAAATLFYLASPIDLIPDCIPVLGMLDDLVIVPLGFYLAIKMIPQQVMDDARAQVENGKKLPKSNLAAAAAVIGIQVLGALGTGYAVGGWIGTAVAATAVSLSALGYGVCRYKGWV